MKRVVIFLTIVCGLFCSSTTFAGTWNSLDYPGARMTLLWGIDGQNAVGNMVDSAGDSHGILYDGTNWTQLDSPGPFSTTFNDISGNMIVGYSGMDGFVYDGGNWTTLNFPGAESTYPNSIDSGIIAGTYYDRSHHGFVYDGADWTSLDYLNYSTIINDISGNTIVGAYQENGINIRHGLIYESGNWSVLDYPGAINTEIFGIDGDNIVGKFQDSSGHHGFMYNTNDENWTVLDFPEADYTAISGIDGQNLVGYYLPHNSGLFHSFSYTVPEPTTVGLLGFGGLALLRRRK